MALAGIQSRTPGGRRYPRAPWDTNRHLHSQESAPSSLRAAGHMHWLGSSSEGLGQGSAWRGLHAPGAAWRRCLWQRKGLRAEGAAWLWEQLGGAQAAAPWGGCATRSSSEGLGGSSGERRLHGQERESNSAGPRAQGARTQPRIWPPPGQAEARRAQDNKDAPAQSWADQRPHPRASRPCRWTALELLWVLNTGFQSWPLPLGLFLLGPHRVNYPHWALHQAGDRAAPPSANTWKSAQQAPPLEDQLDGQVPGGSQGTLSIQNQKILPHVFFYFWLLPPPIFPPFFLFLSLFIPFFSFFLYSFFFFSFLSFFLSSLFLLFPIQFVFGHSALSKMTRRKTSPQKKESETVLSPTELQNLIYNSMSESQFRSTIIQLLVALEKKHKGLKRLHDCRI